MHEVVPIVSICVPAYKYPDLLRRNLLSIIEQSFTSFEVIVTDDSSHNELKLVIEEIADSRIHYYKNPKALGSPANWNESIKYAKGKWIKIMHHDDWFCTNTSLEKFMLAAEQYPEAGLIFSNFFKNSRESLSLNRKLTNRYLEKIKNNPIILNFLNGIGAPSTVMYQNNKGILFDTSSKWCVDVIFYIKVLKQSPIFHYIEEPLLSITANSYTQVTNNTNGLIKVKEVLYVFVEFGYFTNERMPFTFFLYCTELFKRYKISSKDVSSFGYGNQITNKLIWPLRLAKLPFNYRLLAAVRVFLLKRS